jgi:hypothetical protein
MAGRPGKVTEVSARPALAAEAAQLGVQAVETADIVIPVERYSLVYEVLVR